jgi:inhibitor of KinA sporulation pathway (predicted exonuclease)
MEGCFRFEESRKRMPFYFWHLTIHTHLWVKYRKIRERPVFGRELSMVDAVVYDLELVKRFPKGQPSEIVEIGACRVNLETKAVTDTFQIYIAPGSGYITKSTRAFIKMKKEDVKKAVPFHDGIRQFAYWMGDNVYLCSWGKDDKLHLINQCVRNKLSLDWFKNYNDIQQQIGRLLTGQKPQLGLKNALTLTGIEPVGKAHRGIDDAINTALLLLHFADKITLETNVLTAKDMEQQKKPRTRPRTQPGGPGHPHPASAEADKPRKVQAQQEQHMK